MQRWGILITFFYALIMIGLLIPAFYRLALGEDTSGPLRLLQDQVPYWLPYVAVMVAGQASLLLLSVDTGWRRIRPRLRVAWTAALAGMLTAFLALGLGWSLAVAFFGDDALPDQGYVVLAIWFGLWLAWALLFYVFLREKTGIYTNTVSWILRGSVLELLVAVPCHIIVRNRDDCSAPVATGFGIVTGIAIMLMCFGPGVLALYRRRLASYPPGSSA